MLSVNIRGLTEKKFMALQIAIEAHTDNTASIDVMLIHETKSSIAETYHYITSSPWLFYPIHRNIDNPKLFSGGLALLVRKNSGITVNKPSGTAKEIHTAPELGTASWLLKHEHWQEEIRLTGCYWPTGPVPTAQKDSETDHIAFLHSLLLHEHRHTEPRSAMHIIAGDFNLHLLKPPQAHSPIKGQDISIDNASLSNIRLVEALNTTKYRLLSPAPPSPGNPPYTWYRTENKDSHKSTVDYFFGNKYTQEATRTVQILENTRTALSTDHDALLGEFRVRQKSKYGSSPLNPVGTRKYIVENLHDMAAKAQLSEKATELAPQLTKDIKQFITDTDDSPSKKKAETLLRKYIDTCEKTAEHLQKTKDNLRTTNTKRKRSDEANATLRKSRTLYLATRKTQDEQTADLQHSIHAQEQQQLKKKLAEARAQITTKLDTLFQDKSTNNRRSFWAYVQQKLADNTPKQANTLPPLMKDKQGEIIPIRAKSAQIWHECRREISAAHATNTITTTCRLQQLHTRVLHLHSDSITHQMNNPELDDPFTSEELQKITSKLPNNKAPGEDGIPFEIIKSTIPQFGEALLNIYNYLWKHEITPTSWDTAVIHMLHKKDDPLNPNNYRAIVLISTLKKIYEGLIANRLTHYIQSTNCLHKNQFGFLPGRDLTESIFFLTQTVLSNITLNHKPSYVAFIDFKTAFPNTC